MADENDKPKLRVVKQPGTWSDPEKQISVPFRGGTITGPDHEAIGEMIAGIEDAEERRSRWPKDGRLAMTALAKLFPSVADAPGADPWDADQLVAWLNGPAPGSGASWAGRFLLSVWNPSTDWTEFGLKGAGRFDLMEAIACWDRQHVLAIQKWIDAPFWP